MTILITAPTLREVSCWARFSDESVHETLRGGNLVIQTEKTQNMYMDPRMIEEGINRHEDASYVRPTRTRQREQYRAEAAWTEEALDSDPAIETPVESQPVGQEGKFPYPLQPSIKVLGIIIDKLCTLDAQCAVLMAKARTRQSVPTNIAHRKWGMETTILRITHDALVNSPMRYGMNSIGSCMPEDLVNKLDVHIINPSARRISGLDANARIEVLHFLAGTHSYNNLYVCHTASFMHSDLMAQGCQIQRRIRRELCALFQTSTLDQTRGKIEYNKADAFLLVPDNFPPAMLDMVNWEFMH